MMQQEYLPLLVSRYKWHLFCSLKVQIGDLHEIMNIWRFDRLEDFWNVRMKMLQDQQYMTARRDLHALLVDEQISFATSLSDIPV